jgi:hypothetical protein
MRSVEITDESVVVVDLEVLAMVVADRRRWRDWWPDCDVVVVVDRGVEGLGWSVSGALVGYSEISLEVLPAGVMLRYSLSADPTVPGTTDRARVVPDSPWGRRELDDLRRRHVLAWKRTVWSIQETITTTHLGPGRLA